MPFSLTESTPDAKRFFSILPTDWQESIVPYWPRYQNTSQIFVLETSEEVVGGGIIFSTVSPDSWAYKEEAQEWLEKGYLYIGFLWISDKHRGQQLGSLWLQEVFKKFRNQPFWLTIDEFQLSDFYIRNGFKLVRKIELPGHDEWILVNENPETRNEI